MKTIKTTVYTFDELSEEAKENARDWYREGALNYDWWDGIYDGAKMVGLKIDHFDCYRRDIGISFTESAEHTAREIKLRGERCSGFMLADQFLTDVMAIEPKAAEDGDPIEPDETEEYNELCKEFLKELGQEYLFLLDKEIDWLLSDTCVDEMLRSLPYTFTENGNRLG